VCLVWHCLAFFFSSRRRHTRFSRDWSSDVCSSDLSLVCAGCAWCDPGGGARTLPLKEQSGIAFRPSASRTNAVRSARLQRHPRKHVPHPIAYRHPSRSEEHTSELQSRENLVCRLLLEKKKIHKNERDTKKPR